VKGPGQAPAAMSEQWQGDVPPKGFRTSLRRRIVVALSTISRRRFVHNADWILTLLGCLTTLQTL
jgi:hypothetical protein